MGKFENSQRVEFEQFGLKGYYTIPKILTPEQFDEWWRKNRENSKKEGDERGAGTWTLFEERRHLVLSMHIDGVEWDDNKRPFPALVMHITAATQQIIQDALEFPNLPVPSGDTTKRTA